MSAAKTLMMAIEPPAADNSSLESKSSPSESPTPPPAGPFHEGPLTYSAEWERDAVQIAKTSTMLVALLLLKLCFDYACVHYLPCHWDQPGSDFLYHVKEFPNKIGMRICGESEYCWQVSGVVLPLTLTGFLLLPLNLCLPAEIKFATIPLLILGVYILGTISTYFV